MFQSRQSHIANERLCLLAFIFQIHLTSFLLKIVISEEQLVIVVIMQNWLFESMFVITSTWYVQPQMNGAKFYIGFCTTNMLSQSKRSERLTATRWGSGGKEALMMAVGCDNAETYKRGGGGKSERWKINWAVNYILQLVWPKYTEFRVLTWRHVMALEFAVIT